MSEWRFVISTVCGMIAMVHLRPFEFRDGKADSLDRNRSFIDGVLFDFTRHFDAQPPVFGVGDALECNQRADSIDVALHNVSAEAAIGLHGQLQINQRAFMHARERSARPGLWSEISAERTGFDVERCQADPTDRNAVAGFQFFWSVPGRNGDAAILAALFDASDASTSSTMPVNMKTSLRQPNIINLL